MKSILTLTTLLVTLFSYSQSWQDVGGGTNNSSHGMLVWNNQLINLGSFNNPHNRVAAWDGATWNDLGGGVGIVARAGCVWNGNLVVVGDFWNNFQPCVGCNGVAVWDGTSWTALDQGFNNDVLSCTVYNGDLIIGGDFTQANGVPINRVARWNETTGTFESMGAVTDMDNDVRCMTVYDGELWVGGDFNNVGGNSPNDGVVKWDETTQSWAGGNSGVDLVGGVNETVRVLYVNPNDGNLYMGGEFPELIDGNAGVVDYNMSGIAMYDGTEWTPLGTGLNEYCRAIHEYNGNLIVGGYFTAADGVACNKVAKWNGTTFSAMGQGFDGVGIDEYVKSMMVWNGTLFAGGAYTQAEGGPMNYIAQWYEATPNPPTAAMGSSATAICESECINFTDLSTNSPTSWTWSFPGSSTASSTAQHPTNICYPSSGTYTVSLEACNGNGCNTTTMDVIIGTTPTLTVNDEIICDGGSATLTAVPSATGGNYNWITTGETTSSITVNPSSTTGYSVEYSLNGCTSLLETATVTVNSSPTLTVNDEIICEGQTAILTATPSATGGTYDWITTGETSSTISVSPITTTVYDVEYTLNGCTSNMISAVVTVNPAYYLSESFNICQGETYQYPDGTTETISGNTSHTSMLTTLSGCDSIIVTDIFMNQTYSDSYTIDVCSGNDYIYPDGTTSTNITVNESHTSLLQSVSGCDSIIAVQLNVVSSFNTSESYDLCSGDNFTYPDGTQATNIQTNESHVSTLSSSSGCDSLVTTTLNVTQTPTLSLTTSQTICEGTTVILSATPSASGGAYLWSPNSETTSDIGVSPNSTTTYSVQYTLNGCTSTTESTTVSVNPMPDVSVSTSNNIITANQSGANYQWIDCGTSQDITGEMDQTFAPTYNGSFAVEIDLNGCTATSGCETISSIGIKEHSNNIVLIHPNPVYDNLHVESNLDLNGQEYSVYSTDGKIVLKGTLDQSNEIKTTDLAPGTYTLTLGSPARIRFVKN